MSASAVVFTFNISKNDSVSRLCGSYPRACIISTSRQAADSVLLRGSFTFHVKALISLSDSIFLRTICLSALNFTKAPLS